MASASDVTDGPVLTLVNKRIRNLRKKLNRIAQLEESISQGKSVKNKEQEELLKSKPAIVAAVDELEKFRQPLSVAIDEETNLAVQQRKQAPNNGKEVAGDNVVKKTLDHEENEAEAALKTDLDVEDLMKLLYFGNVFDVKSQSDFSSIMLTRAHERNCCLTYDYVTDDAAFMLKERDLDLISMMGSLLISRPMDSSLSHQNALQRCIEHAKLWLANSKQPIDSNSDVTYASLREKLARIVRSEYFRITPEMKAPADVAAEAAGSYGFQVPVQVESLVAQHEQKEDDVTNLQRNETGEDQSNLVEDPLKQQAEAAEKSQDVPVETHSNDSKEQFVPRRNYHNQRGGSRNGGGGGRRGGYGNGRGGRSGGRGGPYQNGGRSNQFNDQPGNYYPRNYQGIGRGRGGRGGGGGHYSNGGNHHAPSGVEVAES